jgi:hypothetical protein
MTSSSLCCLPNLIIQLVFRFDNSLLRLFLIIAEPISDCRESDACESLVAVANQLALLFRAITITFPPPV